MGVGFRSIIIQMIVIEILFACAVIFFVLSIISMARGAPYVATDFQDIRRMIMLAKPMPGEKILDIGSGDGRIVMEFARHGIEAHGYEINPLLVAYSRHRIASAGLSDRARIHCGSFWNKNMNNFDIVSVYGVSRIMKPLEQKLQYELKSGARVVSYSFIFPSWKSSAQDGMVRLYRVCDH